MSLQTPDGIRRLQRKLYLKAKAEPAFRFYLLYDKIDREDPAPCLRRASQSGYARGGRAHLQGDRGGGVEEWLGGLTKDVVARTYRLQPVRRVMIPKPGGARDLDDPGSGGADRCQALAGADLRGGPRPRGLRIRLLGFVHSHVRRSK